MLVCAWKELVSVEEHIIYKNTEIKSLFSIPNNTELLNFTSLYPVSYQSKLFVKLPGLLLFGYSEVSISTNLFGIFLQYIQWPTCTTSWRCSRVKFDLALHSEGLMSTIFDMVWKHFLVVPPPSYIWYFIMEFVNVNEL